VRVNLYLHNLRNSSVILHAECLVSIYVKRVLLLAASPHFAPGSIYASPHDRGAIFNTFELSFSTPYWVELH
jgi:hypothetical protein